MDFSPPGYSLGIDIGGTFTDLVVHDHGSGRSRQVKVLTTPDDPRRGVMDGFARILDDSDVGPAALSRVVHATTLFTNALIERKGARTGLLCTAGFRDTLEIGRERKYDLYDLRIENPEPLVPRPLRLEVTERLGADGSVVTPLDRDDLLAKLATLRAAGVTSVAVVFLHAYREPAHEQRAVAAIRAAAPDLYVTASHEVVREIREYERSSTTVASAYVKPLAASYLDRLAAGLAERQVTAPLLLMLSNGGLTHRAEVQRNPVQMLESGPAAGALAAAFFAGRDGMGSVLAFDMGGTTAKLSLIENGEPLIATAFEAARQKRFVEGSGLPIRVPTVELIEIGAGGGSIARADALGLLKVGPDSAGADPGPACYGRGGTLPTVTDANLLLGYLNPASFAGGTMAIDPARAEQAVIGLGSALSLGTIATAAGIHDVVNEAMAGAARVHIAERGRDPRSFALLVTGGGGPVHGYGVARRLGLSRLVCPPSPGVASAWGLLVAPARVDRVTTIRFDLRAGDLAAFEAAFAALEQEARAVLAATGLPAEAVEIRRLGDGRFVGQANELVVPLPPGPYREDGTRAALGDAYAVGYREAFGRTPPDLPMEFVNARVAARLPISGGRIADPPPGRGAEAARTGMRPAWFAEAGGVVPANVYDRLRLGVGDRFAGPALVEDDGSTLVIGPSGRAEVTPAGSIIVTLEGAP